MQGVFAPDDETKSNPTEKRTKLGAISNVPWRDHIGPSHDRDTQRRMRDHRESEVRYQAASDEIQARRPRVMPYPQTPDAIFPGVPCYKMLVNGVYRLIFVVPSPTTIDPAWDGAPRAQSSAHWIVPHFIYRDEVDVRRRKARYNEQYEADVTNGVNPQPKRAFDSRGIAVGGIQFDCYYSASVDNPNLTAPPILDPLFNTPFCVPPPVPPVMARPYPYDQPRDNFPSQPMPRDLPAPPAVAGAAPPVAPLPPQAVLAVLPPAYNGENRKDWVDAVPGGDNVEIGADYLKGICEQAEEQDYTFALSMQGLKGASLPAVWNCIDPEYDVSDRSAVLAQFVKLYMEKFYSNVQPHGPGVVEDVVYEALNMHEEFCKGWVSRHHRTLSAEVTAASEALVGMFFDHMKPAFPANVNFTRSHFSRYLRRTTEFSGEFAHCLYHYMTNLEQMRGNRNPSYRAMQNEKTTSIVATKTLAQMFQSKFAIIRNDLQAKTANDLLFHPWFIDWHYIAAQMPAHHKEFDGYTRNFALYRTRAGARANTFPPWQQMRFAV